MTTLDPERQKQAKQYARIRRRLWLVDTIFSAVYALLWLIVLLMPVHAFLSTWLGSSIGPLWLFKSWKEIVLGALLVAGALWLLTHTKERREILADKVVWLAGLYALVRNYDITARATGLGTWSNRR